ncbi:MAG: UDP-2,3-diacylglucosamine diphosphatase LpxI [Pseudomonadota bacterium]
MKIGLIAGGGQFPVLFAKAAAARNLDVYAAAYMNEASKDLSHHVKMLEWIHLGQVSRLVNYFRQHDVSQAVMLGTIKKTRIFSDIRPDLKGLAFIAKFGATHDNSILSAFANLMAKEGIAILPSTMLLPELVAEKGLWTRRKPGKAEMKDIRAGWTIAREIGRLDIGQCIVISNGTVLAVEAADGTDATIRRGGELSDGRAVVIKLCKPNQDQRFDLPSTGLDTVRVMSESGAGVLVLEAGKSLAFDREEMIRLADKNNMVIFAMEDTDLT